MPTFSATVVMNGIEKSIALHVQSTNGRFGLLKSILLVPRSGYAIRLRLPGQAQPTDSNTLTVEVNRKLLRKNMDYRILVIQADPDADTGGCGPIALPRVIGTFPEDAAIGI